MINLIAAIVFDLTGFQEMHHWACSGVGGGGEVGGGIF